MSLHLSVLRILLLAACLTGAAQAADPAQAKSRPARASRSQPSNEAQSGALEDAKPGAAGPAIRITKTTRNKPAEPPAQRAWLSLMAGNPSIARAEYEKLLQTDPRNTDALIGLAHLHAQEGNPTQARIQLQRALDINPREPDAQAALLTLTAAADPAASESQLKQLINLYSSNANLHFALGVVLSITARHAEAKEFFQRAVFLDPHHPDYQYNLAVCLDQLRERPQALAHYRGALESAATRKPAFNAAEVAVRIDALSRAASPSTTEPRN